MNLKATRTGQKDHLKAAPAGHKGYIKFIYGSILVTAVVLFSVISNTARSERTREHAAISRHGRQLLQEEEVECREVHNADDQCGFILNTSSCEVDGYIDYNAFVYCDLSAAPWAGMLILIIWWLFWFVGLAVSADDFFCPSLVVISKTLRLSPNVAGVTFLAFGNGAPDLFSAIAALSGLDEDTAGLGVGGLLGAGMFVTTVVTGTVALVRPFKAMERPFLRDTAFYLGGVYWTFCCLWRGKMYLAEAIGYITAYVVYVVVVVVSGEIHKKQKEAAKNKASTIKNIDLGRATFKMKGEESYPSLNVLDDEGRQKSLTTSPTQLSIYEQLNSQRSEPSVYSNLAYDHDDAEKSFTRMTSIEEIVEQREEENGKVEFNLEEIERKFDAHEKAGIERNDSVDSGLGNGSYLSSEREEEAEELGGPLKQFIRGINPINVEEWSDMGVVRKFYEILKCPLIFVITLTCPVVNYEVEETHNWNKYLQIFQCIVTPTFTVFVLGVGTTKMGDVFPVWALTLIIGVGLAAAVFFTSVDYEKPKYHWVFGYVGFVVAMVWIFTIANIIVTLLGTFGIVLNISDAILGLTLLAWGNSIGDWIADTVMARQGFARMGFSACFGAPFFNLMLGFGIPMLYTMGSVGRTDLDLQMDSVSLILCSSLLIGLCCNIIIVNASRFKITRYYGIFTIIYYLVFLTIALLTETGVILENWEQKRIPSYD